MEVRDFHLISVYVSEPTKVKMDENENDVIYCPSTFTKQHAFKVAPPLPTFESMLFHELMLDALDKKLGVKAPTSFQSQIIPILLEERSLVAKACAGYGKTLSLCLAAIFKAFEFKRAEDQDQDGGYATSSCT